MCNPSYSGLSWSWTRSARRCDVAESITGVLMWKTNKFAKIDWMLRRRWHSNKHSLIVWLMICIRRKYMPMQRISQLGFLTTLQEVASFCKNLLHVFTFILDWINDVMGSLRDAVCVSIMPLSGSIPAHLAMAASPTGNWRNRNQQQDSTLDTQVVGRFPYDASARNDNAQSSLQVNNRSIRGTSHPIVTAVTT